MSGWQANDHGTSRSRTTGTDLLRMACLILPLGATLLASSAPSRAQEVSFAGKTVRMILGQAAGGGADVSARLIAAFLSKYLPGSPVIIVQNMPGANGISAANQFVTQVAPDGLTFIAGSGSQVITAAEKNSVVKYDPAKFEFIGSVQNPGTVLVAAKSAIPRLTNPAADAVIMAQVGVARPGALFSIWGKEFLGWNVKTVTGYPGSQEVHLAVLRGEAEMMDTGGINVIGPMVSSGKFAGVAQIGLYASKKFVRRDAFPDVPLISEMLEGKVSGNAQSALDSWLNAAAIGKYYALPPNTPAQLVAAYREAFTRMQDDPDFQDKAKVALDPDYAMMSAEDTRQLVSDVMRTTDADRQYLGLLRDKHGLYSEAGR
jgi:tripartite-type tricarboxylate transporter receptor subunit TctC